MKALSKILSILILAAVAGFSVIGCTENSIDFKPKQGQRIVILGNTFAERFQYFNYFEPLLYKSFPDLNLTVRNMGWSADEVGLQPRPYNFGTLDEHLTLQQADIIFACFGLNEAFKVRQTIGSFEGFV